jgi:hypothetical protein
MAPRKSKTKSSPRLPGKLLPKRGRSTEEDFLDLPEGWRFMSRSPRIGLDAMIRFCEANLALFNSRPGAEEQRLREKCNVPFVL